MAQAPPVADNPGAVNPILNYGPCDNQAFFTTTLNLDPLFQKLVLKNINEAPFIDDFNEAHMGSYAMITVKSRKIHIGSNADPDSVKAVIMAELLAPYMPNEMYMGPREARAVVIQAAKDLGTHDLLRRELGFTKTVQEYVAVCQHMETPVIIDPQLANNPWNVTDIPSAIRVFNYAILNMNQGNRTSNLAVLANVLCSVAKRGTMTGEFANRVSNGINEDLGDQVDISEPICKVFYAHYGNAITSENAALVKARWTGFVPQHALRLGLIVQRMSHSGLTGYLLVGKAMTLYADFPWKKIKKMFPTEWTAYRGAITAVGRDAFYGYNSELGAAKSTNYKSLIFVAKELLIKVGGERTLSNYRGFVRGIAYKNTIDALITEYQTARDEAVNAGANAEDRDFDIDFAIVQGHAAFFQA